MVTVCKASNQCRRARQTDRRSLARIPPTSGEQIPQKCPPRLQILQWRGHWCLSVTSRVHLTVDDARSTQLSLATGARWERIALSDLRQPKTQTQSHSGIPPSSASTGNLKQQIKKVLDTQRSQPRIHLYLSPMGQRLAHLQKKCASRAGAPANGSSRPKPNAIG